MSCQHRDQGFCALCADYGRHSQPEPQGKRFTAKYEGICSVQGDVVMPGDRILFWGEEHRVAHADCLDEQIELFQ